MAWVGALVLAFSVVPHSVVSTASATSHVITLLGSDIDGEAAGDVSGAGVSMSTDGSRVAIGAYGNDANGADSGHVRIYDWDGSTWTQVGSDIDGEAAQDFSGFSVSMSSDGSRVAIGAYDNDGVNGADSGHVRIYDWNGSTWTQLGSDIDGEAADDELGISVSLSSNGSRLATGGYRNDGTATNAGHVRVYDWDGSAWTQVGSDIDGEAAQDGSGYSVSMSSDGTRVAIGAYTNDGVNGADSGHVRIYDWNGSTWVQMDSDIDGEDPSDNSGISNAISADGLRVAIGAFLNGGFAGHVRVYQVPPAPSGSGGSGGSSGSTSDGLAPTGGSAASALAAALLGALVLGAGAILRRRS